jgi:hypothetical protein
VYVTSIRDALADGPAKRKITFAVPMPKCIGADPSHAPVPGMKVSGTLTPVNRKHGVLGHVAVSVVGIGFPEQLGGG